MRRGLDNGAARLRLSRCTSFARQKAKAKKRKHVGWLTGGYRSRVRDLSAGRLFSVFLSPRLALQA